MERIRPPRTSPRPMEPVAVSLFAGAGGSCEGYRQAGYDVAWACEFVPHAASTYAANHPATILDTRDIRQISGSEILDALNMKVGDLDMLDGSPPCAPFSPSGRRHSTWGKIRPYSTGPAQRVDDLFDEYI